MQPKPSKTHFTIPQLAKQWQVSPSWVRRRVWSGELGHTRFGRLVRISASEAERFASQLTNAGASDARP